MRENNHTTGSREGNTEHRVQKWREFWVRQDLESDSSSDREARTGDRITDTIAVEEDLQEVEDL